jgi:hypothetical protein
MPFDSTMPFDLAADAPSGFDASKPFEVVGKSGFDPSKPFEKVSAPSLVEQIDAHSVQDAKNRYAGMGSSMSAASPATSDAQVSKPVDSIPKSAFPGGTAEQVVEKSNSPAALAQTESLDAPFIKIPKLTESEAAALVPGALPNQVKIIQGIHNWMSDMVEGFTTPASLAIGAWASVPGPVGVAVKGLIAADMAKGAAGTLPEIVKAYEVGDVAEVTRLSAGFAANAFLSLGIGKHAIEQARFGMPITEPGQAAWSAGKLLEKSVSGVDISKAPRPEEITLEIVKNLESVGAPATADALAKSELVKVPGETVPGVVSEPVADLTGMGAAVPSELERGPTSPTNITNEQVRQNREARGLPDVMATAKQSDPVIWERTMARIDREPGWQDSLISELEDSPRSTTPEEVLALDHRYVDLKTDYERLSENLARAYEDGRSEDAVSIQVQMGDLGEKINRVEEVAKTSGAEMGRAFRMRRVLLNEDFSLAGLTRDRRNAKGGAPLDNQERIELQGIADEYKSKVVELERHNAELRQTTAAAELARAHAEALTESSKPPYSKVVLDAAKKWVDKWDAAAEEARVSLAGKFLSPSPEDLLALAKIARSNLAHAGFEVAKFTAKMIQEFGPGVEKYLTEAIRKGQEMLDFDLAGIKDRSTAEKVKRVVTKQGAADKIKSARDTITAKIEKGDQKAITVDVQKLFRALVEQNPSEDRDVTVGKVHDILKEFIPAITRLETMDAISGRGKFWEPSQDAISKRVRDLKTQIRLIGHQIDVEAGRPLPKTGFLRGKLSDAARREEQKLQELKRKFGVVVTDPAKQLAGALQARKTFLENRMKDLRFEISKREKIIKQHSLPPTDSELEALQKEYEQVKKDHAEVFPKEPRQMTDEQRLKAALKSTDREIAQLESDLDKGKLFPNKKASKALKDPALLEKQAWLQALREHRQELRDLDNPKKTKAEIALQSKKTRMQTEIATLLKQDAAGDFPKKTKTPIVIDAAGEKISEELARLRKRRDDRNQEIELANRKGWQKALDRFVAIERGAFKLSSPVVFGKLTFAAITRAFETATSESVGGFISLLPIVRDIAAQAPREGRFSARAFSAAYVRVTENAMRESAAVLKTGRSSIDVRFGDKLIDKDWASFFGRVHAAIKEPVKQAEWAFSLQKRIEHAILQGLDVGDSVVRLRLQTEALDDAYRSIFMQHGFVSDTFNNVVGLMLKSKKYPVAGEISARTARLIFPVVRVPLNIVAETATGIHGVATASARTMFHVIRGDLNRLDPKIADGIMRQFKKGSIGLGLMALGYFSPENVGGLDFREKRKEGDVKAGGFQINGVEIPRWMTHAPWFNLMQVGASVRHIKEQIADKRTQEERGLGEGAWGAMVGLLDETPFIGELHRASGGAVPYFGNFLKGLAVPQIVSKTAEMLDPEERRKPTTILEHIESGIPGLRENVPTPEDVTRENKSKKRNNYSIRK